MAAEQVLPDMRDALLAASLATGLKFSGLNDTDELVDTVVGLFPNNDTLKVNSIKGTVERFKTKISVNISNEKEAIEFIDSYCQHNEETLKVATTR